MEFTRRISDGYSKKDGFDNRVRECRDLGEGAAKKIRRCVIFISFSRPRTKAGIIEYRTRNIDVARMSFPCACDFLPLRRPRRESENSRDNFTRRTNGRQEENVRGRSVVFARDLLGANSADDVT